MPIRGPYRSHTSQRETYYPGHNTPESQQYEDYEDSSSIAPVPGQVGYQDQRRIVRPRTRARQTLDTREQDPFQQPPPHATTFELHDFVLQPPDPDSNATSYSLSYRPLSQEHRRSNPSPRLPHPGSSPPSPSLRGSRMSEEQLSHLTETMHGYQPSSSPSADLVLPYPREHRATREPRLSSDDSMHGDGREAGEDDSSNGAENDDGAVEGSGEDERMEDGDENVEELAHKFQGPWHGP